MQKKQPETGKAAVVYFLIQKLNNIEIHEPENHEQFPELPSSKIVQHDSQKKIMQPQSIGGPLPGVGSQVKSTTGKPKEETEAKDLPYRDGYYSGQIQNGVPHGKGDFTR